MPKFLSTARVASKKTSHQPSSSIDLTTDDEAEFMSSETAPDIDMLPTHQIAVSSHHDKMPRLHRSFLHRIRHARKRVPCNHGDDKVKVDDVTALEPIKSSQHRRNNRSKTAAGKFVKVSKKKYQRYLKFVNKQYRKHEKMRQSYRYGFIG